MFIHDYIQLVFQDEIFSIYNPTEVLVGRLKFSRGMPGFADAFVGLIEKHATSVTTGNGYSLQVFFEGDAVVKVLKGSAKAHGPEAWQFGAIGGPVVVEAND